MVLAACGRSPIFVAVSALVQWISGSTATYIEAISAIESVLQNMHAATTRNIQIEPAVPPLVRPKILVLFVVNR